MKIHKDDRTKSTVAFLMNAAIIVILSLCFYYIWMRYFHFWAYFFFWGNIALTVLYAILLIIFNHFFGGFQIGYSTTSDLIFSHIIALFFANAVLYTLAVIVARYVVPARPLLIYFFAELVIVVVLNVINNKIYYHVFPPRKTLLIFERDDPTIEKRIEQYQYNSYKIEKKMKYSLALNSFNELNQYKCIIAVGLTPNQKSQLAHACFEKQKSLYIVPDIYDVFMNNATNVYLVDTPVYRLANYGPSQIEKIVKRIFDIFFSLVLLLITSPIILLTAIIIKLQDGGPVFYKQVRLTQYGRTFKIIKFRSMKVDAEKDGVARLASEHDDRITPFGKFIRSCRIDELPQLINILKGDMSVVGPRPERPEIVEKILEEIPEFNYRLNVKAGLTGYAQVYGKYNTKLKDKLLFDLMYIQNYSVLLDIRIMFLTFKILFMKESTEGVED